MRLLSRPKPLPLLPHYGVNSLLRSFSQTGGNSIVNKISYSTVVEGNRRQHKVIKTTAQRTTIPTNRKLLALHYLATTNRGHHNCARKHRW